MSIHWLPEQSCPVFNKLTRHEPAIQSKNQHLVSGHLKKHLTSMSCQLEPAIWSRDTGQRIPCFERCQLIITWMSNTKEVHCKPRVHVSLSTCYLEYGSHLALLHRRRRLVAAVVRTRPRAIPLAMITMRKSTHGFPFVSHIWVAYGAPLGGPSGRRSSAII